MSLYPKHPKATPQHRLAGLALEIALVISTCFIGWAIWSLVIWSRGQTPAKQILKMQVVGTKTGAPASWGHMAIRQFLVPIAFSLPFTILQFLVNPMFSDFSYWSDPMYWEGNPYVSLGSSAAGLLVNLASWGFSLADALWIFQKGQNRRITDI